MDLSKSAITGWHALMPARLRAAVPNDTTVDWDGPAARLAADLTLAGSDIGDVLARHAGTIAGFGAARRTRTLAWIATRALGSTAAVAEILAQGRLGGLRPFILRDLAVLVGATSAPQAPIGNFALTTIPRSK